MTSIQHLDPEETIEPLPEDNDTPFSLPDAPVEDAANQTDQQNASGQLDPTHPRLDSDSDIDDQQAYDEGLAGAAEASEPNAGNDVVGYHPENDERRTTES
jgi:hypothetical protein